MSLFHVFSVLFLFLVFHQSQILTSIWDRWTPKYWPNLPICCVLCFQTLSTQGLQLLILFGIMLPKSVFGINGIPNTDLTLRYAVCCVSIHFQPNDYKYWIYSALCFQNQYSGLTQPQMLTSFGKMLFVVFPHTLKSMIPNIEINRCCVSKIVK